jgi:SAM-dependent methyltransferase
MKNKDFFYQQYNKINWRNQDKTKINSYINSHIIDSIILKHKKQTIRLFDIGFGIGLFFEMLDNKLGNDYESVILEGCEPAVTNFDYFKKKNEKVGWNENTLVRTHNLSFLNIASSNKFDFITAIYVFPNFLFDQLDEVVQKIYSLLDTGGKFILVVAEENYLKNKLDKETDLCIEKGTINYNGKKYEEVLHYTDIPEIGKVIDYNRSEAFYDHLFLKNGFKLISKETVNDSGFVSTLFVFEK